MQELNEKVFDTGEVLINYAEGPDNGMPILLLHGAGSVWEDWQPVIKEFYRTSHVYALDLRGCGKSGRSPHGYRFSDFASDAIKFIHSEIGHSVTLIGHSLGAMTGILVAAESPEIVSRLILEDPPFYIGEYFEDWMMYPFFPLAKELARSEIPEEKLVEIFIERLDSEKHEARKLARSTAHIDPALIEQTLDMTIAEGFDPDALLRRISCPVLLLHGEETLGSALRREDIKRASVHLSNAGIIGMEGLGHGLHMEDPDRFCRLVMQFLKKIPNQS